MLSFGTNISTKKPILDPNVSFNRAYIDLTLPHEVVNPLEVTTRILEHLDIFLKFTSNFMIFYGIQSVLRYCINYQYFNLGEILWEHSHFINFNNFSTTRPILDLKLSLNRTLHQDLKLWLRTNFSKFTSNFIILDDI